MDQNIRNRIHQRESRARRKTYVSSLESKIRHFEQAGVQATAELQIAARNLDQENRLLRSLLCTSFGMSNRQIGAYLDSAKKVQDSTEVNGDMSIRLAGNFSPDRPCHPNQASARSSKGSESDAKAEQPSPSPPLFPSTTRQPGAHSSPIAPSSPPSPPPRCTYPPHTSAGYPESDTIPCEEAATILASLRGLSHDSEVVNRTIWPELGCQQAGNPCFVRTITVFQLAS